MADAKRYLWQAIAVAVVGVAALSGGWVSANRPLPPELQSDRTVVVSTSRDSGVGSLREAIFAAASGTERVRIHIKASRIDLETALPPIVNSKGVVVDAEDSRCRISGRRVGGAPVLDVAAPNSVISGLTIQGAAEQGIMVRAASVHLRGVVVSDSAEAVRLTEAARGTLIDQSRFHGNGVGIIIPDRTGTTVRQNQFSNHDAAAIWAVSDRSRESAPLAHILNNTFQDDRIGVAAVHVPVHIERNEFRRERESAIYLMGRGSVVRGNRVRDGGGVGIFADGTEAALIEKNEVDRNAAVGLMVRSSQNTVARQNRVYLNAYGMAVVFGDRGAANVLADNLISSQTYDALYVVGSSPLLRGNIAIQNRNAALRILDFIPRQGPSIIADPLLKSNRFEANLQNQPVHDVYRVKAEEEKR